MKEKDFIEFARTVGKLKRIPRTGWKIKKIKNPESVADHSFRTALLGMVLSDLENMNTEKIMRMLLLHDIEESVSGDINAVYKAKMNKEYLKEKQERALQVVYSSLPGNLRNEYLSLWKEMEECKTREAKFCRDVDKLEMMIQASDYEDEDKRNRKKLSEFWSEKFKDINVPKRVESIVKIYKELKREMKYE
ncbi:hypothetical protein A3K64_00945 [Candidatus Micrarchaeota archaeon RBG_16_36_9]|nr:MAG: hypothetical protein A3K64_00945 [Candidatus Micrarchaeota archaeon RBG_16_36_9]